MGKNINYNTSNNDVALLVVSCDAYKDLWDPFFKCLFKYWPDCPYQIYLGTNRIEYLNSKVSSILIGPDKDYTSNLLAMLEKIDTPWIILWIEDLLLTSPINTKLLSDLIDTAQKKGVGYLKLATNTPWAYTDSKRNMMGPIPKGVKYRSGIGLALWKKNTLIKLLNPGESAWEIERQGSKRSNQLSDSFYALSTHLRNDPPIHFINSVIKGKWNLDVLSFLKKEGLKEYIPNRSKQTFFSYVYIKFYLFRLSIFRILGKYWYD